MVVWLGVHATVSSWRDWLGSKIISEFLHCRGFSELSRLFCSPFWNCIWVTLARSRDMSYLVHHEYQKAWVFFFFCLLKNVVVTIPPLEKGITVSVQENRKTERYIFNLHMFCSPLFTWASEWAEESELLYGRQGRINLLNCFVFFTC